MDRSNVGIGIVLIHRYPDGIERLKDTSSNPEELQPNKKEALAIIFTLSKSHLVLYGRPFILVTDHKSMLSIFSLTKANPALAANRLERWAITLPV